MSDNGPRGDNRLTRLLMAELEEHGFDVVELSAAQASDLNQLTSQRYFLYIIPKCRTYPAAGLAALVAFVQGKGHVLFLGGPLLDNPVWHGADDRWLDQSEIAAIKQRAQPTHDPFPHVANLFPWRRTTNNPQTPGSWKIVNEGPAGKSCFRFTTENLTGWDGYMSPDRRELFGAGDDLFTFFAKGSERTTQVAVEIQEEDGSRWIAVARIGPQWRRVALELDDFKYWPDASSRSGRGGAGDQLNPAQARRVSFQLAQSHTTDVAPGKHTFWIAEIGTCKNPVSGMNTVPAGDTHPLEGVFPRYKVYPLHEPMNVAASGSPGILAGISLPASEQLICAIPRTTGRGFQRDQRWRYIPLAHATDAAGRHRGSPAWLLLNCSGSNQGSVLAGLGWTDPWQQSEAPLMQAAAQIAQRLSAGLFLQEAGAEHFAYWPEESIQLGTTVMNVGRDPATASIRLVVKDDQGKLLLRASQPLEIPAQSRETWQVAAPLRASAPGTMQVTAELVLDNRIIDSLEHEITVLDAAAPDSDAFMQVAGNNFVLRGRKWYPVGVNYWPLYVSGMDRADYWAGWIERRYYDPALVEQDLARMEALGINLVSIQSNDPQHYRNLVDFIHRCDRHKIYVNLFCGLASPIDFREDELREFIRTARLADNPAVMAYDTIWEPGNYMFRHDWRARWDGDWQRWIVEQYGNFEAADEDWQFLAPRDKQRRPIAPPEKYFREDGPWRVMMAAYRRFMDDLMSRKWNQAHRSLRDIDPNHLISFRQGNTLPHDFTFTATAKHIDFICPEGYSIPHTEDGYYTAGFITKYVHFTTHGKPIVWSEFGQSVWDAEKMEPSAARIKSVADYHDLFYRMVLESGANGTIPWWWPGGYRVGERSDYGIVNPDGTPRPAAQLISQYAPQLTADRNWPEPTAWFEMDRDAHAGGYWYTCFNTGRDAYRQATSEGKQLGIRSLGTGTTSADVPLVAVGNRPLNGRNPAKFLNSEFNSLQICDVSGQWVEASDAARIRVAVGQPVVARVSVGNTQEATWLPPDDTQLDEGDVVLKTTAVSQITGQWPLPRSTPYLADADFGEIILAKSIARPTIVELRMFAHKRTGFGEKRTFQLVP